MPTPAAQTMTCMEIWGGNQIVDTSIAMSGLNAWVYSKPYGQSAGGGDVHYVSSCATGRVTRLLIADVSGHGAQVCDVAGTLRSLMRRYVNYIDQSEFVRSMNRQFVTMSESSCFATAIVTTFFGPTNSLTLCNAGHPPPLWYRAKTRRWEFLEIDESGRANQTDLFDIPLGVEDETKYGQLDVTLGVNDLVLCYTDSLIEARDPAGEVLGIEGLLEIVRGVDATNPDRLIPTLLAAVAAKNLRNLKDDDVTVLLFRSSTAGVQAPLGKRLLAPFRVAREMLASLRKGSEPAPLPEFSVANIGGTLFGFLNRVGRRTKQ
jgi:sigma-B regulation protein RsbU (phosphoserine phosphatase)